MNSQTIHETVKLIEELIRDREDLALRLEGVEAHRERLLEDARTRDELQAKVNDLYTRLGMCVTERDEARATKDLHKERQQELETALNTAVRERDEARAELRNRRADFDRGIQEQNELRMRTEATVERLRAAQQIPDVGPVTRDEEGQLRIDGTLCYQQPDAGSAALRYQAATRLAMAAFLDAEADETSSDDEDMLDSYAVQELTVVASDYLEDHAEEVRDPSAIGGGIAKAVLTRLAQIDAHRARGGQEAARDR